MHRVHAGDLPTQPLLDLPGDLPAIASRDGLAVLRVMNTSMVKKAMSGTSPTLNVTTEAKLRPHCPPRVAFMPAWIANSTPDTTPNKQPTP